MVKTINCHICISVKYKCAVFSLRLLYCYLKYKRRANDTFGIAKTSEETASKMSRLFITSLSHVCGHVQNMENKFYPIRTHVIPYDK